MAGEPGSTAVVETIAQAVAGQTAANDGGQTQSVGGETVEGEVAVAPLDPGYVARAKHLNLTEAELRSVPQDMVERMIAGSDRQMIETYRREQHGEYQPAPPPVQHQRNGNQNRQDNGRFAPVESAGDFAFDPYEIKFEGDIEPDDPLVKNQVGLKDWTARQLEKLQKHYESKYESKIAELETFRDHQIRQQNNAVMDRFVAKQGSAWESVFGKGPTSELNTQSQEFLNRAEVWTAADVMVKASARNGVRLSVDEAQLRASNAMFMEKAFAIERARTNEKRTQLESGATERPRTPGGVPTGQSIKDKARLMAEAAARA